eukprot:g33766.t1
MRRLIKGAILFTVSTTKCVILMPKKRVNNYHATTAFNDEALLAAVIAADEAKSGSSGEGEKEQEKEKKQEEKKAPAPSPSSPPPAPSSPSPAPSHLLHLIRISLHLQLSPQLKQQL